MKKHIPIILTLTVLTALLLLSGCGKAAPPDDPASLADENGFCVQDGILYAYVGDAEEVTIPEEVTEIYSNAFAGDMDYGVNLKKVTVPGSCHVIDEQAFAFTNADVIVLEEGVLSVGEMAFMDSYIDEIWFPESLTEIGSGIMETEEGLNGTKIHVVKGSLAEAYFTENPPYGSAEIISE